MEQSNSAHNFKIYNILIVAFVALCCEQILHEVCHGIAALLVGASWDQLWFWASASSWPEGASPGLWQQMIISGSAAVLNILCALVCIALFNRNGMVQKPFVRLFLLYFGGYSLFAGFGYLFFDPIFANPKSAGDWAKIVMLLGGGWNVRLPILLIGVAGTVYGYFWVGKAALQFTSGDMADPVNRKKTGTTLLLLPYLFVNAAFTILAIWHPLGVKGLFVVSLKLWSGFSGFLWAYLIKYQWGKYHGPFANETPIPDQLNRNGLIVAVVMLLVIVFILLPGVRIS